MITGAEFRTSNTLVAFPFVEDTRLADAGMGVHGAAASFPVNGLVDAVILAPEGVTRVGLRSATYASANTRELALVDQTGASVCRLLVDLDDAAAFPVLCARDASAGVTVRVVGTAALLAYLADTTDGTDDVFSDLWFAQSVVESAGLGVRSIGASDVAPVTETVGTLSGLVSLVPGYNTDIQVDTESASITLTAAAGAGAGVAPCHTDEDAPPRPFNSLRPDARGNVRLEGEDCYSLQPIGDDALMIHGACTACCKCADMVATAEDLKAVIARIHALRAGYDAVRESLAEQITLFNDYVSGVRQPPTVAHGEIAAVVMCSAQPTSGTPKKFALTFHLHIQNVGYTDNTMRIVMSPTNAAVFQAGVMLSAAGVQPGSAGHTNPAHKFWLDVTNGQLGWTLGPSAGLTGGFNMTATVKARRAHRIILRYLADAAVGDPVPWHPPWAVGLYLVGDTDVAIGANPQPVLWAGMPKLGTPLIYVT